MLPPPLLAPLSGEPRHAQAARTLRAAVRAGDLPPGARLPGNRELAQAWQLSRSTVSDALAQLAAEGYLEVRPQSGSYVRAEVQAGAAPEPVGRAALPPLSAWAQRALDGDRQRAQESYEVDFRPGVQGLGLFPSSAWTEALARRARATGDLTTLPTTDPASLTLGPLSTRTALATALRRERGAEVTPEMILLTSGTQMGLDALARSYLEPGRVAVLENPVYPGALRAFGASGARLCGVAVDDEGLRPDELPAGGAALAYLTPGCQYPTTAALSAPRRSALLTWARACGALLIEDDYAADFHHSGRPPAVLQGQAPERVVLTGSFTPSLAPALRSGYLVAPPAVLDVLTRTRPLTERWPPTLDALALGDFLESGGYARHLRRARQHLQHRQEVLAAALAAQLPGLSARPASAGLHLCVPLPREVGADWRGTAAAQGVGIGLTSDHAVGRPVRPAALLAFGHLSPEAIRDGVARLGAAWRSVVD